MNYDPDPYAPCPCGSGKKYKFCCRTRDRAAKRIAPSSLGAGSDGRPIIVADLAEGEELNERGLSAMNEGRFEDAARLFEASIRAAPIVPTAHHNLALARYGLGDLQEARRVAEHVTRLLDPESLFAFALQVHFDLFEGRREAALHIAERMVPLPVRTEHYACKKVETFARFRWHERVLGAAEAGLAIAETQGATLSWFAGVALANLGRYEEAVGSLQRVPRDNPRASRARRFVSLLERKLGPASLGGDWPYLMKEEWISPGLLDRAKRDPRIMRSPCFVEAIRAQLEDDPGYETAIDALQTIGTEDARAVLRLVAGGTFGSGQLRLAAMAALRELGEGTEGAPERMWMRDGWRQADLRKIEITGEAVTPLPDGLRDEMNRMVETMRARDWSRAEEIGRALLASAPCAPSVLLNLGETVRQQGRKEEGERLFERALAADPGYLFARAALIRIRLEEDRADEASRLAHEVVMPARVHPSAYANYLHALAILALAEGDLEGFDHAAEWVKKLAPDSGLAQDLARGEWIRRLQKRLEGRPRPPMRRRLLPPEPSQVDCLERHLRAELLEAARQLGLRDVSALPKHPLAREVSRAMVEGSTLVEMLSGGTDAQRAALGALLEAGGTMPFAEFTKRFGGADAEGSALHRWGRVALLAEGTIGGEEVVVVPVDLRGPLQRALAASRTGTPAEA